MNRASHSIPRSIIGTLAEVIPDSMSHANIDTMFAILDVEGDEPTGNKNVKTLCWLNRYEKQNHDKSVEEKIERILSELVVRIPNNNYNSETWKRISSVLHEKGFVFDGDQTVTRSTSLPEVANSHTRLPFSPDAFKTESNHVSSSQLTVKPPAITSVPLKQVFLVHGQDHGFKNTVARFLEKLDLEVIILHEQDDDGGTIASKLEQYSSPDYAVVLLTKDDECTSSTGHSTMRARQNVVFEMGLFIGKLGKERVCSINDHDIDVPSDMDGVVYIPRSDWKSVLIRRLTTAGAKLDSTQINLALSVE